MSRTFIQSLTRRAGFLLLTGAALGLLATGVSTKGLKFYPDDPIAAEPESQDASKAQPYFIGSMYEMTYNLFVTAGYKPTGVRAQNINTIDEVPDSSWFTNRIGTVPVTVEQITRGPNRRRPPDPSHWVLTKEKTSGVASGLHGQGREGRHLVPRVRSAGVPRGRDGGRGRRDEDLLGAWLQPGGVVPDDVRSEERRRSIRRRRSSGRTASATPFTRDDINAILEHVAQKRGRHVPDHRGSAAVRARSSAASSTTAPVRTIPTTSSRTSIAASCARCACSARGRT